MKTERIIIFHYWMLTDINNRSNGDGVEVSWEKEVDADVADSVLIQDRRILRKHKVSPVCLGYTKVVTPLK